MEIMVCVSVVVFVWFRWLFVLVVMKVVSFRFDNLFFIMFCIRVKYCVLFNWVLNILVWSVFVDVVGFVCLMLVRVLGVGLRSVYVVFDNVILFRLS